MKEQFTAPNKIFSEVLLEKLTMPGVIFNALSKRPPQDIYFAVAGIAFDRWVCENNLQESDQLFSMFFARLKPSRQFALHVIQIQANLTTHCAYLH